MLNALSRDWGRYGFGISAITVGVAFVVFVGINATDPIYLALVFQGVVPGAAFVAVGIWAIKRPADLPRVLGAAAGALSAPLYYPLVGFAHPNDVGADIGRGLVGVALPVILPLNMWICATVGQRVAERRRVGLGIAPPVPGSGTALRMSARAIGLGAMVISAMILWQAISESSVDPRVANWEIVHHGVLPAAPIAVLGLCAFALTTWLPMMCGALLGTFPAVACSSLLVDPNPANHGQVPEALLAYSLPVTLPITVGLGALAGDRIERRIREFRVRRSVR